MAINFDKILGNSDAINYLNDIYYISKLIVSNKYHNYIKYRQSIRKNRE